MTRRIVPGAALVALLAAAACGASGEQSSPSSAGGGADADAVFDAGGGEDSGTIGWSDGAGGAVGDGAVDDSRAGYCASKGPPVIVGDQGDASLGATADCFAAWAFRSAVCACDNIQVVKTSGSTPGYFRTDGFDSTQGPYDPATALSAGRVGCISTYGVQVESDVGGDLVLNSETALFRSFPSRVRGELWTSGGVIVNTGAGRLDAEKDAWVAQALLVDTTMTVGGTLYRGVGAVTAETGQVTAANGIVNQSFDVPEACACGPDEVLDVGGYVKASQGQNDNAEVGLSPSALTSLDADATFDLPCGRFYVDGVTAPGHSVILHITGHTALMVDGPLLVHGLTVALDPGAELDLFVAETFAVSGPLVLGDKDHPAAVRVYLGGEANVVLTGQQTFVGNLYAPRSSIIMNAEAEVFGSLFGNVIVGERLAVHFDTAVQLAGTECGEGSPPPPPK